ncbi:MAG: DUF2855 family protein [Bacteroidota bacterium]
MSQFQVHKTNLTESRLVHLPASGRLTEGQIKVSIEAFAYTANNITYGVAGDRLGYWQFFPPVDDQDGEWGILPVWGFAKVIASHHPEISVGERFYGYFPPATSLIMMPQNIKPHRFLEASPHRQVLPAGYNFYSRVQAEPHYDPAHDKARMLLAPLHITAYFIWDHLQDKNWFGAKRVIILSASSKTSTGLAFALQQDENSAEVIGLTSTRNLAAVRETGLYQHVHTYEEIHTLDPTIPTVMVDMAGNRKVQKSLFDHLGTNFLHSINVGITHWTAGGEASPELKQKSELFFAPMIIQKRIKDWGYPEYEKRTQRFLAASAGHTSQWLQFRDVNGLEELAAIHADVCAGKIPANQGLIVTV